MLIDEVNAVRPSGVSRSVELPNSSRTAGNLMPNLRTQDPATEGAFFFILWAGEDDFVFDVAFHLPDVAGMRFQDVHHEKSDCIAVLLVQLVEGGNLPPEGRSSVAAEDQHDRLLPIQSGKLNSLRPVQLDQREVWSRITHMQGSSSSPEPHGFKWVK